MAYNPLELLVSQVEERRVAVLESINDGSAKDYAEYKMAVGMARGLLTAQYLIKDLAKKMEESDE